MDAFKTTINDIVDAVSSSSDDKDGNVANLVASFKNTMGDQGPTNPQFNAQLKEYREQLLPKVVDNWEQLTGTSRDAMIHMGYFFCKMHILVNFATEADKILKINEGDIILEGTNPFAMGTERGAARLVRTAAKSFTDHGCDKSGMAADWMSGSDKFIPKM